METYDLHMCVAQKIWSILKLITSSNVDQTAVTNWWWNKIPYAWFFFFFFSPIWQKKNWKRWPSIISVTVMSLITSGASREVEQVGINKKEKKKPNPSFKVKTKKTQ